MDSSKFVHQLLRPQRRAQRPVSDTYSSLMSQGYDCLVHPCVADAAPPVVTVGGAYSGALRTAILEWKEAGWSADHAVFVDMILEAVQVLLPSVRTGSRYLLVPVPTGGRARLTRGGDLLWMITRAAASARNDLDLVPVRLLRRRRGRDQVGLSARERVDNANRSYRARRCVANADPVILVDDVVTTGATLAACAMTLRHRGWHVAGAVVLSGTKIQPRRGASA